MLDRAPKRLKSRRLERRPPFERIALEVFCVGIFLSFGAHFVLVEVSHAAPMQIAVSITGIMLMTVVAFYRSWSKRMDKSPPKPTSQLPVDFQVARAG